MKYLRKIKKEHVWLTCIVVGPILAYLAIFYPAVSIVALVFILIGLKGILVHIM